MCTVSVVIPTYNRARLVERAIRSVLTQTVKDWELLVVDDGSTDNTEEVVRSFQDPRIRYVGHHTRRGASAARNIGMNAARGEYVAFLDSDDEWLPKKLERQVEVFRRGPSELGLVCTGYVSIRSDGQVRRYVPNARGYIYPKLFRGQVRIMCTSSVMCRRDALLAVGGFDEAFPALQDHDLWFRLSKIYEVDWVSGSLTLYHAESADRISASLERALEAHRLLLRKYAAEFQRDRRALAWRLSLIGAGYYNLGNLQDSGRYFLESLRVFPFQPRVILRVIFCMSPWLYRHRRFYRRYIRGKGESEPRTIGGCAGPDKSPSRDH